MSPSGYTGSTRERDKKGRWVHTPRRKKQDLLSDYYSFHLVDDFVGVKQA